MATNQQEPVSSILLVRLSAVGDVLFGLPALEALARAFPQARIDWLAEEKTRGLLEGHPALDRVLVFPRKTLAREFRRPWTWPAALARLWRHVAGLRARPYDLVLDLQGNMKSSLQVLLARGKRKIGFRKGGSKEGAWLWVKERVDPGPEGTHRIEKDLRLAAHLGIPAEFTRPALPVPDEARREARAFWEALPGEGPRIAVHPGSSAYNAYKRWPPSRYGETLAALAGDLDARIVLVEGRGEEDLVARVRERAGLSFPVFPQEKTLLQVAALLGEAHLFLGGDSAPMHLAHLQGIPCVALFGPKSPSVYGPYRVPSRILRYPTPCHPCRLRSCPVPLCILGVHPRQVIQAVRSLWEEIRP